MDRVLLGAELRALKQLSGSSKNTLQNRFCKARMATAFRSQRANPRPALLDLASFFPVQPTGTCRRELHRSGLSTEHYAQIADIRMRWAGLNQACCLLEYSMGVAMTEGVVNCIEIPNIFSEPLAIDPGTG